MRMVNLPPLGPPGSSGYLDPDRIARCPICGSLVSEQAGTRYWCEIDEVWFTVEKSDNDETES